MKKYLLKSIAMFFAVSCIVPAQAFDKNLSDSIDKQIEKCMISENYTTAGMNACVFKGEQAWLEEINKLVKKIKKELSPKAAEIFEQSHKHWLEHYKSEEALMHETLYATSGTIYTNYARANMYNLVEKRAKYLDVFYHDLTE